MKLASIQRYINRAKWRIRMVGTYFDYLRAKGVSELTIEWHMQKSKLFLEWLNATHKDTQPVTPETIRQYLDYRRTIGCAPSTIAGDYRSMHAGLQYAYEHGIIPSNPCASVKPPKAEPCREDPFTPAEVSKILYSFDHHDPLTLRNQAIILFLYDTGCRVTAMCNIKLYDFDWDKRRVRVKDKYSKYRYLSWGDRTQQALIKHKVNQMTVKYFFENNKGRPLTRSGVYQMFKKACFNAGVRFRKVHLLRSAYSCQFLMTGGPERAWQLQMILGHSDMSQIKEVYGRTVNEILALDSMQKFSPGDRLAMDYCPKD